jgi:hypothetical protein
MRVCFAMWGTRIMNKKKESPLSPVKIFDRLLARKSGTRRVHYLTKSRDFFDCDWTYKDVEKIEREFGRELRRVAAEVETVWGTPAFLGRRERSRFANWWVAEELCYWKKGRVFAVIWWEHQDKELPVILAMGVFGTKELDWDPL